MDRVEGSQFDVAEAEQVMTDFQQLMTQFPDEDTSAPVEPLDLFSAQKVIEEFKQLNFPPEPKKTIFEIVGLGHLENVSSKTLEFFLDSTEKHGLGDLCLRVLLDLAGVSVNSIKTQSVKREVRCKDEAGSGRVDLVVTTGQYAIVIENKLNHHANSNPFDLYFKDCEQKYSDFKRVYILIGLKQPERKIENFRFVSHFEFGKKVKEQLGHHLMQADQHYLTYLIDYLNTIETYNPTSETGKMEQAIVDFYRKNRETLLKIEENTVHVHEYYDKQLKDVISFLKDENNIDIFDGTEYLESVDCLSNIGGSFCTNEITSSNLNFTSHKYQISLEKTTEWSGICFHGWITSMKKNKFEILKILDVHQVSYTDHDYDDGWVVLLDESETISAEEFANKSAPIIKQIMTIFGHEQLTET